MTAIFGVLGPASGDDLDAMANRLSHKGQHVYKWSPAADVWLGEVRHYPRQDSEPEDTAFSGRLYVNWNEVPESADYDAFDRDMHQRRLAASAVHANGADFASALDGHFGVAKWDSGRRQLLLGVDRINGERIYYTRTAERFVFATEYKALLALADVSARPNPDVLQFTIATFNPDYRGSRCNGIERVSHGHMLTVNRDGQQRSRYYQPQGRPERGTLSHFAEGLRNELLSQVSGTLGHHERIALTLSGGLDSAGLLGILQQVSPDATIASYTIGTGEDDPEIIGARAGAKHFNTEHHEYRFDPQSLVTDLPKITWLAEEYVSREEAILQYQVESQIVGREKVLTGGHGADMVFAGMPRHRLIRMAETLPFARRGLTELFQQTQSGQLPKSLAGRIASHLLYRGKNIGPPQVTGATRPASVFEPRGVEDMLNHVITDMDGFDFHCSFYALAPLEVVMPFLSKPVIDYSLRIPVKHKTSMFRQKIVLREALAPLIPDEIRERGKAIQRAKRTSELSDVLDTMADQLLSPEDVRRRQLIDPGYVNRVRRRPADGIYSGDQLSRLWILITTELWCRTFIDNRGAPYGFSQTDDLRASTPQLMNGGKSS